MIILKEIRHRDDLTVSLLIEVGNEFGNEKAELVILEELLDGITLSVGEMERECLTLLDKMADATAAYRSALSSLGFVVSSHKALYRKLLAKGYSKEACERAIELVREKGYIDESSLAIRRAELMVEKRRGKARIISKLYEEGFCEDALEDVREFLSEIDFSEVCATFIEKKYGDVPTERREREKMFSALMRAGFSPSEIKEALKILSDK